MQPQQDRESRLPSILNVSDDLLVRLVDIAQLVELRLFLDARTGPLEDNTFDYLQPALFAVPTPGSSFDEVDDDFSEPAGDDIQARRSRQAARVAAILGRFLRDVAQVDPVVCIACGGRAADAWDRPI